MVILGILFPAQRLVIWLCMVAAASPDLMWAYYHLYVERLKNRKPHLGILARFHAWVQWSQTPAGWLVEAAWFMLTGSLIIIQMP